ncbi:MAG: 5'-methylthioadenosine/adenosylhomocysteine nucleosidase [Oscillospiraceae bacterium]|nr:5'-methylthioadenosine/adenosylhomocysteine nucleosidase [Oscillospiraceae bacterium]
MKKLGIIGAMTVEVETLKGQLQDIKISEKAGMIFYDGMLDGLNVVVVQCGIGKVNAGLCVQILCDCFGVTHIVNTGVAGSLCAQLDIGDFVISRDAMYHDFTCNALNPDYLVGQVPGLAVRFFPADEQLVKLAYDAAQQVHAGHARIGRIASGDQFVASKAQKEQIIADTEALCTEMEGAAIAHAAWRNGIPFVVIRAISDKADDSAEMDYPTFEAIAAKRCADVTQTLAQKLMEI